MLTFSLADPVLLAVALFCIGACVALIRTSAIMVFMGVEIMLNAANLLFVTFALRGGTPQGHAVAFMVMAVAAAEAVVGLAIFVALHRHTRTLAIDAPTSLAADPATDGGVERHDGAAP